MSVLFNKGAISILVVENLFEDLSVRDIEVFNPETKINFMSKPEGIRAYFTTRVFEMISNVSIDPNILTLIKKGEPNSSLYLIWPLMKLVATFISSKKFFLINQSTLVVIHLLFTKGSSSCRLYRSLVVSVKQAKRG